ncbi:hypothetical protein AR457_41980 (plasmid) [Streptomyces agglomeratus]|uniref:hypothetical protein n=1 Tax=Streptomyces agglomeratus TaxID=285458 RepID=UPI000853FBAB|nr:hypothetical protein [Streptomyces agglomeratus]OEJ20841.1 hypothetical protein AR457_41980 [Streptomyces agglomeratus]
MRQRLAALLLALVAVLGLAVAVPQPAAADGPISNGIEATCRVATGPVLGTILGNRGKLTGVGGLTGASMCDAIGEAGAKKMKEEWDAVWDSVLGDVINSAKDVVKWVIKKVLTVALLGPSVDLAATGLFGKDATLAGMLTWLGLVIAAGGMMWQIGKMAITGQSKHAGRAALGWVENIILSAIGVAMFAGLLVLGDALTAGLVNATFDDDGEAYERIVAVMVPAAISNPITVAGVVLVLLLVGFIQLVMVFLRQSAIPIICLLLPVAGGGRAGGDATRQWAPKLITSGLVVVAYKPTLAIIICTGFAEFGHSKTLTEWLRGCATLVLAVLAPGPLTKIFAPFGAAVGAGMAAGGASGALGAAASYMGGRSGADGASGGSAEPPTTAVEHSKYVEQQMAQGRGGGGGTGEEVGAGGDAQAQASRNETNARVPGQAVAEGEAAGATASAAGLGAAGGEAAAGAGAGATGAGAAGAGGAVAGPAALGIQVLDGVNNTVQGASGQIGNGGNQ